MAGSCARGKASPATVRPAGTRHWLPGKPVRFQLSHEVLTSIPTKFPCVEAGGRCVGQDPAGVADQTTSATEVRRVDIGGCGPLQPPKPTFRPLHQACCRAQDEHRFVRFKVTVRHPPATLASHHMLTLQLCELL